MGHFCTAVLAHSGTVAWVHCDIPVLGHYYIAVLAHSGTVVLGHCCTPVLPPVLEHFYTPGGEHSGTAVLGSVCTPAWAPVLAHSGTVVLAHFCILVLGHSGTDNRRLRRSVKELQSQWKEINAVASKDPELKRIHRDGHCHEAVMWYVHHLSQEARDGLKGKITLPLLSYHRHEKPTSEGTHADVHRVYEEKVTCFSCH